MEYDFSIHNETNITRASRIPVAKDNGTEREVLYGTDLRKTVAPQETIRSDFQYQVAFKEKNGSAFGMNNDILSKHLLLLGGIGCGKTNVINFIIESLQCRMTNDDVMLIFDTKGDFKKKFYRQEMSTHWLIGNDSQYHNISRSWNIFDELKDENGKFTKNSELVAKEIAKQLFKGRESETQPFFSHAAADLVSKVLIHLMRRATRTHLEERLNTEDFVRFLKSANRKTYYDMTTDPNNPDFISAQLYFGAPDEKMTAQALGIFGYINSMVNDLFVGVFAERRWAGSFSMRRASELFLSNMI